MATVEATRTERRHALPRPHGAFDANEPPDWEGILDCMHCGICLPQCPTYRVLGQEMDSPRGRVYLMRAATEGRIGLTENFVLHMDRCLGCRACETACPAGVPFGRLLEETRGQIERNAPRPLGRRLLGRLRARACSPSGERLGRLLALTRLYQRSGLQRPRPGHGPPRALPAPGGDGAAAADAVLHAGAPRLPAETLPEGAPRGTVALLEGCVQALLFPEVNRATVRAPGAGRLPRRGPRGTGLLRSAAPSLGRPGRRPRAARGGTWRPSRTPTGSSPTRPAAGPRCATTGTSLPTTRRLRPSPGGCAT